MTKFKKIIIFFLLAVITVCVVLLPQLASRQNLSRLLNKTSSWTFSGRGGANITGSQVAELYYGNEINDIFYDPVYFGDSNTDATKMRENYEALIDNVFDDPSIRDHIKAMLLTDGVPYYGKKNVLTMVDERPIVLGFISVSTDNFEFIYEEKTKTLISFSFFSEGYSLFEKAPFTAEQLQYAIELYYGGLELSSEQFYFYCEDPFADSKNDYEGERFFYTNFGLSRQDTVEYDKTYILYSFDTEGFAL